MSEPRSPAVTLAASAIDGALWGDGAVAALFADRARLDAVLRVEAALAEASAEVGLIPEDAARRIAEALPGLAPDPADLAEGTVSAGLMLPALVGRLRAALGADGDWLHYGATSQDVLDTALMLQLGEALALIEARLDASLDALAGLARTHADLPMAARTRTQVATPTTFGLRVAGWHGPLARARGRLDDLRARVLVVQLGGASGTQAAFGGHGERLAAALARRLGLGHPAKPWHAERDRLADLASWLGIVTAACARIGADVCLMARSDVAELRLAGGGSSTMPQKANPTRAEALVALGRLAAADVAPMHEAAIHAEERDLTAWAIEWHVLPALVEKAAAALRLTADLAASVEPVPEAMRARLDADGGAALAEALAFALAPSTGLAAAQAAVKRAVAGRGPGETLAAAVARETGGAIDPAAFDDPAAHVGEARRLVAAALDQTTTRREDTT